MSAEHMLPNTPLLDLPTIAARCWAVADLLATATALAPAPLKRELARRERDLTILRDALIAHRRAAAPGDTAAACAALDAVNTALSLLFGLEYPGGPLDRTLLTQAAGILRVVGSA